MTEPQAFRAWMKAEITRAIAEAHASPSCRTIADRERFVLAAVAFAAGFEQAEYTEAMNGATEARK